ncbi:MAG: hypothetical protein ACPGD5_07850, partial [Salibacteraceae bacterium]
AYDPKFFQTEIVKVEIDVYKVYKGELSSNSFIVYTGDATCSYPFELDLRYLVFSTETELNEPYAYDFLDIPQDKIHWTDYCYRTSESTLTKRYKLKRLKKAMANSNLGQF